MATLFTFTLSTTMVSAMKVDYKKKMTITNNDIKNNQTIEISDIIKKFKNNNPLTMPLQYLNFKKNKNNLEISNIIKKFYNNTSPIMTPTQYINLKKEDDKSNENSSSILFYPPIK